jgi:FkbM family methyltransferase
MKEVLKKVYDAIPLRKQLFETVRFFGVPPYSVYKHLHFTGIIKLKVDKKAWFKMQHHGTEIENDLFWKGLTGGWEKISMQYWIELSRSSKKVLDIGANTGVYSLVTKSVNPLANVYAFEPLKQMFRKLTYNNELNNYDIVCVEKAASDKNGKTIIYETGSDHVAAASLNGEVRHYGNLNVETEIEAITLDKFIDENNLGRIDLIKMDVEGHEPNVLEGYRKYLPLHRPDFLIEVLADDIGKKVQQIFDEHDYYYFNIDDKKGTVRRTDTITKSDYFNYLICTKETAKQLQLI